jgi:REP element-mobilizing transposase RayT
MLFSPYPVTNTSFLSVMPIHTRVTATGIYFITFTCHQWLQLIELVKGYDLVYKWFDILSVNGHTVTGYVIMPNHLHLLLHYVWNGKWLNTIIGNGKRFMAYDIIDRLKSRKEERLLTRLRSDVCATDKMRGKKHEVWKDSFDVKQCRTEKFLLQKLTYIHNNPCTGKWTLADSPIHYPHSSALFYMNGKPRNYPVKDYQELLSLGNYED